MHWVRVGSALAMLLTLAASARAQDAESRAIAKGRWSLAFSLPDGGGGQLGVWKMVSARSNLGLNLGVRHEFREYSAGPDSARFKDGSTFWTFSIEPRWKRYLFIRERISPFFAAALQGSYGGDQEGSSREITRSARLTAGIGADWTPLHDISIGASTGFAWTETMLSRNDSFATKQKFSDFDTTTGALTLHLYF